MNIFGDAHLAANVAVEMPESEVGGSHYRVLFLSALVLLDVHLRDEHPGRADPSASAQENTRRCKRRRYSSVKQKQGKPSKPGSAAARPGCG